MGDNVRLEDDSATVTREMQVLCETLCDLPFQKAPTTLELSEWIMMSASS